MEKKDYRPSDARAAEAFEGKMYEELTPNQQDFVRFLFGNPFEKRFHCALCDDYEKADFYLECDDLRRYVSLKGGRTDTVHHEHIKRFILFLRELGISREAQKALLFFHYGDGTMTGEGARRYEANELREILRSRIAAANVELNKPRIVRACAKRFLFDGSDLRTDKADVLAYGDPTYFIYASKEEILAYLAVHDYSRIQTLHVGPMIISPWIRNLKRDENVEWKRSFVHIRYVNLMGDIERLNENRKRFIE